MHALLLALVLSPAIQGTQPPQDTQPESIYASWSQGPSTDPDWFPIGVWLQDPKLAQRYARLGINTYVGLWQGPTKAQLEALKRAEMDVICGMNKLALELADDSTIIGWMLEDEPDNKKTPPAKLKAAYGRLRERDSSRPVWLNLGQGVANDQWRGRRSPRSWYPEYVAATDIISFDVYPITNIRRDNGVDFLWYLAKGLRRLEEWSQGQKPRWNLIECTRIRQPELKPTPSQVESEVWISLVNGSRGIVYFCHNFVPKTEPAALLADKEMSRAVTEINRRVLRYAPQLNAPSLQGIAELEPEDREAPVAMMVKRSGSWTYLFCVGMRNRESQVSISDLTGKARGKVEVLDEKRALKWSGGSFVDHFDPYEVHIYRYRN